MCGPGQPARVGLHSCIDVTVTNAFDGRAVLHTIGAPTYRCSMSGFLGRCAVYETYATQGCIKHEHRYAAAHKQSSSIRTPLVVTGRSGGRIRGGGEDEEYKRVERGKGGSGEGGGRKEKEK